ncbi:MAG: AbrB/MazE/SpoVT family DNA-binding domain-containing protein [Elusimicrobia bacterium]|nr:AbrB/MazE/SpoVT family DNA-binding domain-containing protein [Elusimicrobiota bacterium]
MDKVTVSSKYQVVIPKEARRKLKVRPGQKLGVFVKGSSISLVCERALESLRGIMRGVELADLREKKERPL